MNLKHPLDCFSILIGSSMHWMHVSSSWGNLHRCCNSFLNIYYSTQKCFLIGRSKIFNLFSRLWLCCIIQHHESKLFVFSCFVQGLRILLSKFMQPMPSVAVGRHHKELRFHWIQSAQKLELFNAWTFFHCIKCMRHLCNMLGIKSHVHALAYALVVQQLHVNIAMLQISPHQEMRGKAKVRLDLDSFVELHLSTPMLSSSRASPQSWSP